MHKAGIAELKARLSEYLARVKRGAEVVVTERGVPIAKLVPLGREESRDSRRERLIRDGLLVPGRRELLKKLRPPRGKKTSYGVLEALLAEREEGR